MKSTELKLALDSAVEAARQAGALMRKNFLSHKRVNEEFQHDIKLELDVRCQKLIHKTLYAAFPKVALLGEEGTAGEKNAAARWVVDPIDGTVNFAYGIPHAAVSIALQTRREPDRKEEGESGPKSTEEYETQVGVIYDPFLDELWTAIRAQKARLNGRPLQVSKRRLLREAVISVGFAKKANTIELMLPTLDYLLHRVRKVRIMGSAALSIAYVATGRFDAYLEAGLRLWDIAAGALILECAHGEFWFRHLPGDHAYEINANNGLLREQLAKARGRSGK